MPYCLPVRVKVAVVQTVEDDFSLNKQGLDRLLDETWNKLEKQQGVKGHPFILQKNKDTAVNFATVS
jgi:hypothetical protein